MSNRIQRKTDWIDWVLWGLAAAFIFFSLMVIGTAKRHADAAAHEEYHESWQPPTIPDCDKELWLRIKDGCDD